MSSSYSSVSDPSTASSSNFRQASLRTAPPTSAKRTSLRSFPSPSRSLTPDNFSSSASSSFSTPFRELQGLSSTEEKKGEGTTDALLHSSEFSQEAIRSTVEYRIAWDVEWWRAVQLEKAEKELAEERQRGLREIRLTLGKKEAEKQAVWTRHEKLLAQREAYCQKETRRLEEWAGRLGEAEKELQKMKHHLLEGKRQVEQQAEQEIQKKRLEMESQVTLIKQQLEIAEEKEKQTHKRLEASQKEYLTLYEAFAEFKVSHAVKTKEMIETECIERCRKQMALENEVIINKLESHHNLVVTELKQRLHQIEKEEKRWRKRWSEQIICPSPSTLPVAMTKAPFGPTKSSMMSPNRTEAYPMRMEQVNTSPPEKGAPLPKTFLPTTNSEPTENHLVSLLATLPKKTQGLASSSSLEKERHRLRYELDRLLHQSGGVYTLHTPIVQELTKKLAKISA